MKLLRGLVLKQEQRCFWCDAWLITGPYANYVKGIIKATSLEVTWIQDGEVCKAQVASLDHLIPQWLCGPSTDRNLRASCVPCNTDRGTLHSPTQKDFNGFEAWVACQKALAGRQRLTRLSATIEDILKSKTYWP